MKVFEVFQQSLINDAMSIGLFSTFEKASVFAQDLANKKQYKKIDEKTWGEQDDYGLLRGAFIIERELE